MSTEYVVLANSYRPPSHDARRVRDLEPTARIDATVTVRGPALPSADEIGAKPLSPEAFASQYGAQRNAEQVAAVLRGFGLTIDSITQAGRSVQVSGPASAIEAAFKPNLGVYESELGEFRGREGELQIPKQLDGIVTGVLGLDQRRMAHRKIVATSPVAGLPPQTPADLEKRYNFPAGTAKDQIVAIAEFGEPLSDGTFLPPVYLPEDLDAFCKRHGRPLPKIQVVPVNIAPLTLAQLDQLPEEIRGGAMDEAREVMMDVQVVATLCPEATLLLLFASFDQKGWIDLLDAVTSATHGVPVALSISWGLAEDSPDWSSSAVSAINERLQIAAMQGITVCVSSGDDGSSDGMPDAVAHVDFPASSPFVLGVGGTQLRAGGSAVEEVAWWDAPGRRTAQGGGASGGGVSARFPRPAWQTVAVPSINAQAIDPAGDGAGHAGIAVGAPNASARRSPLDGRVVPDVAGLAGSPYYDLQFQGAVIANGGTSASAPLWASLLARVQAALPAGTAPRFLTPLLYGKLADGAAPIGTSVCRAITSGNNASHPNPGRGYDCGPGYSAVTGWGSPDGAALLDYLRRTI